MKKRNVFLANALLLSVASIILRGIAVSFNAYVNRKIGAESMGLFTLVMSVYGFAVTVALSCVNLGSVKLTSERCAQLIGHDKASWKSGMRSLMSKIILYSLIFGLSSGIILFTCAGVISEKILSDTRTVSSLKILALSLPAISLSSGISGFFTGMRKVSKNVISSVSEQLVKITVTSTALFLISPGNVEHACMAVVGGSALAEAWSFIVNIVMYILDTKKPKVEKYGGKKGFVSTKFKDVTDISFTAALGTYARQGLTTLEHLAIPKGLRKSGLSDSAALSSYGLLQGIALPLVMFPYAVISSFTSLLIPEIAEKKELGDKGGIMRLTREVYRYSAVFSVGACGIFVNYAAELGNMIYNSEEAAAYTLALGFLVPFMYLDTAVDALLKGMGEQVYNMKINILDSAAGLILVMLLTPRLGIKGYIITVWICELGNLAASFYKLSSVTNVRTSEAVSVYIRPVIVLFVMFVFKNIFMKNIPSVLSIIIFASMYILLSLIFEKNQNSKKGLDKTSPN